MSRQVATNVVATPLLVSFSTPFYSHLPRCTRPKSLNRSFSFSFSPSISLFVCTRCPRTTDAKTSLKGRMVFLLSGYKWICLIILRIWIRTELLAGDYHLACWNKQKCWLLFVRKIRKIRKMVQHSSGLFMIPPFSIFSNPEPKTFIPSFRHIFWNHIFCISESSPVRLYHPSWDTLYIYPSLSLWRRLEPTSGCVQKTEGGGNEKRARRKRPGKKRLPAESTGEI